jgi:1,4-dihydroxy-2-naphthoyl-CoA synthase
VDYEDLSYEVVRHVATITIDRPDRLNALRRATLVEIADALDTANCDRAVGVIVITGAGDKAFSAGGDLETVGVDEEKEWTSLGSAEVLRWVTAFRQSRVPIIAKVRGYCIGLGNELNLLCDLTVAARSAQFGQAGPKVGSVPLVGGTQMLPLVSGLKRAKEVLYLCRRYSGQAAVDMGLANVVVDDDDLDAEVDRWCVELLEKSPQSLRIAKLSLSFLFDLQWASLQHGLEITGWMVPSSQMQEGSQAFLEKRPARFRLSDDADPNQN